MPPVVACQYYRYMKIKLRIVFDWQMEQMKICKQMYWALKYIHLYHTKRSKWVNQESGTFE